MSKLLLLFSLLIFYYVYCGDNCVTFANQKEIISFYKEFAPYILTTLGAVIISLLVSVGLRK